jgi:hypothetical protein
MLVVLRGQSKPHRTLYCYFGVTTCNLAIFLPLIASLGFVKLSSLGLPASMLEVFKLEDGEKYKHLIKIRNAQGKKDEG